MKAMLIVRTDFKQIVFSAENDFERALVHTFAKQPNMIARIRVAQFTESAGGYVREYRGEADLIIVFDELREPPATP